MCAPNTSACLSAVCHVCYFLSSQLFSVLGRLNACIWCEQWKWWLMAYMCGNLSCGFKWGPKGHLSALFVTDRELISHTASAPVSRLAVNIRQKCNIYFCILFSCRLTGPPHFTQSTFGVVIFQQCRAWDSWVDRNSKNPNKLWAVHQIVFPRKDLLSWLSWLAVDCVAAVPQHLLRVEGKNFYTKVFDLIPLEMAPRIIFLSVTPIGSWWKISSAISLYTEVLEAKHQGCLADTCHKASIVFWLCWF